MKKVILLVLMVGFLSCQTKETKFKEMRILRLTNQVDSLTNQIDSLSEENHMLSLELSAQSELVYAQDTTITMLQKQLKK